MSTIVQSQLNKSRKDKFLLVFDLPPILREFNTGDLTVSTTTGFINKNSVQFSVFGSVAPEITVPASDAGYANGVFKVSSHGRSIYEDVTVRFTIDNRFSNYFTIYKWLNLLSDDKYNIYDADNSDPEVSDTTKLPTKLQPASYQTNFTLYAKDEFDVNVAKFVYTKAFPTALGGIEYNYRDPDEIETTFSFAFSQFHINPV